MKCSVYHLVAHCRPNRAPLALAEQARWLWERLREDFPDALGAALMPNHVHLVLLTADPDQSRRRLAALLASFSRRFGHGELWLTLPVAAPLASPDKALRQVRYVHLNPCRPFRDGGAWRRLVDDPLRYAWTTHRDLVGAVGEPWLKLDRVVAVTGWNRSLGELHGYLARDPSTAESASRLPVPAPQRIVPVVSLRDVALAAAAATRAPPSAVRQRGPTRDAFVGLALHQGWHDVPLLAEACGTHRGNVARIAERVPSSVIEAAALCLGDQRLLGGEAWTGFRDQGSQISGQAVP